MILEVEYVVVVKIPENETQQNFADRIVEAIGDLGGTEVAVISWKTQED